MSRRLMHSFKHFCDLTPVAAMAMCRASMYRFARSELVFLNRLNERVTEALGNHQSVLGLALNRVPQGGIPDTPTLNSLLDCIHQEGQFACLREAVLSSELADWFKVGWGGSSLGGVMLTRTNLRRGSHIPVLLCPSLFLIYLGSSPRRPVPPLAPSLVYRSLLQRTGLICSRRSLSSANPTRVCVCLRRSSADGLLAGECMNPIN